MEEDEKESDEIEKNVGGDRGLGSEKEEKETEQSQTQQIFTPSA